MKLSLMTALFLLSTPILAQDADHDFGDLIPDNHFVVTQKKSSLKDSADITNYQIKVSPQKDEFTYKINSVRTPRKLFKKSSENKVTIERNEGKITRITSIDYSSDGGSGVQGLTSAAVGTDGKVDSYTHCFQDYKFGLFGLKKDKSDLECVTVNKEVCSYLEKNNIDEALVEKINNCSDLLGKLGEHQENFDAMVSKDQSSNMKAINKLDGRVGSYKNFYDIEPKTLKDVSHLVRAYGSAVDQCAGLKKNNYLREDAKPEEPKKDSDSGSQQ